MRRRMEVSSVPRAYPAFLHPLLHHRNPALLLCLSVVWGYDSDVAREKAIDYTTKIYAVSIREMEGTKPHQQMKEVSVEERYAVSGFACTYVAWWQETHWNQSTFSLPPKLLLKPIFIFVYAQSLHLYTGLSWRKFPTAFNMREGWVTVCRSCLWKMTWWDVRFDETTSLLFAQRGCQDSPTYLELTADGGEHADQGDRREGRLLKSRRNTCGLW